MASILLQLVEKQMARWQMQRQMADLQRRPGRCLDNGVAYGPCLLISRERGSGGGAIGCLVGERLGWHLFNKSILDEIAQLPDVQKQLLDTVEEETQARWEEAFHHAPKPGDDGYEKHMDGLRRLVLTLGHQGGVIIVGRGAQHILPTACALRVRVVAPTAIRIQRLVENEKMSTADAEAEVHASDCARIAFVKHSFDRDHAMPHEYDLVINTERVTYQAAADMVLSAMAAVLGVRPRT